MTTIQTIFEQTKKAFDQSDIKAFAEKNNFKWFYSIASTRLSNNCNLIVGFNCGAGQGEEYLPQTALPSENFKDLYEKKWLGSFERIYQPLKTYFPENEIDNSVQTNFCFFRSKEEGQISNKDISLSIPLFQALLNEITPVRIIGFSTKLRDYFLSNNLCTDIETCNIPSNNRTLSVAKGFYKADNLKVPIYFLPHPNAQVTTEAKNKAWEFCFGTNIKIEKTMETENSETEIFSGSPSQLLNFWSFVSCILIIPIPFALWNWLQVKYLKLRLTNHRLIMTAGVFSRSTSEIELYRIRDVSVHEPFIFRLFGLGNVHIFSTDKSTPTIRLVAFKNPHWLKDQIRKHAELYRQNRKWGTIN